MACAAVEVYEGKYYVYVNGPLNGYDISRHGPFKLYHEARKLANHINTPVDNRMPRQ